MSNVFKICDKCKKTNVSTLVPKLKEIDPSAIIKIGCQNYCGVGRNKCFVFINNIPINALTEDELIIKVKEFLK